MIQFSTKKWSAKTSPTVFIAPQTIKLKEEGSCHHNAKYDSINVHVCYISDALLVTGNSCVDLLDKDDKSPTQVAYVLAANHC